MMHYAYAADHATEQHALRPLEDLRVIAVEQYGAGPFGSLHLADLGAEVIKIEDPRTGGDISRYVPPFQADGDSLFYQAFNRNKKSIALDLSTDAGQTVLRDLAHVSDVVYSNLRGDVPKRLGLLYNDLSDVNPRIVCCSLSGFGMTGPRASEPAYDYVVQGMTGWMALTGDPDDPPTKTGLSLVDFGGGIIAAMSVLAAVHAARRDGVGGDCDVSLYDVGVGMLNYLAAWHLNRDYIPRRTRSSAHPSLVPFQNFATADGWIVVACAKEKFWQRLTTVLGHPEWATDSRFLTFAARRENAEVLLDLIGSVLAEATSAHWLERLRAEGIPSGPINTLAEVFNEPHTAARGLIVETEHPTMGQIRQVLTAGRVGAPRADHLRAPMQNEHRDEILGSLLGYDAARIAELGAAGAFGDPIADAPGPTGE
jgi:crotonobetainyl-CoA:carnitine CoA-transferase CaiB-like acyl-CoA transferase